MSSVVHDNVVSAVSMPIYHDLSQDRLLLLAAHENSSVSQADVMIFHATAIDLQKRYACLSMRKKILPQIQAFTRAILCVAPQADL